MMDSDAGILDKAKARWFKQPNANQNVRFVEANFVETPFPVDAFDAIGMIKTY